MSVRLTSRRLLITTAVLEAATALALIVTPSMLVGLLLGTALDLPGGLLLSRITGAALLALALACLLSSQESGSSAGRAMIASMLLYNVIAAVVLIDAKLRFGLTGIGLLPAIVVHGALALWCGRCLKIRQD